MIWDFIQNQILGMKWMNDLIGNALSSSGMDLSDKWAGSLQFFIYDVIKITILLCFLIFVISYIQSYFPPERSKKILGKFHGIGANSAAALLGTVTPFKKIFPYILVGVGIGAVIHNWIPQEWVSQVLGSGNPFGVVLATLIGIPMYADIFGTIPIAEALLFKGALLGSVLSFMMAVTTLSLPSMIMLAKAIKPELLTVFIAVCAAGIIFTGYFFNLIQIFIL